MPKRTRNQRKNHGEPELRIVNPYPVLDEDGIRDLFSDIEITIENHIMLVMRVEESKTDSGLYLPEPAQLSNVREERPHDPVPMKPVMVLKVAPDVKEFKSGDYCLHLSGMQIQQQTLGVINRRGYQAVIVPTFCAFLKVDPYEYWQNYADPMKDDVSAPEQPSILAGPNDNIAQA